MDMKTLEGLVPEPGAEPDWHTLELIIPGLADLANAPQDPIYHSEGNVLIHTRMVVNAMVNGGEYATSNAQDRFILFMTCLLHDIAKLSTTVIDEDTGRIRQPGHSARGAIDARLMLWRAGVPFQTRESICRLISVHQIPFFALAGDLSGNSEEFMIHRLSWELPLWMLCAVAKADMEGRGYTGKQAVLDDIEVFRLLAEEEGCLHSAKSFPDAYTRMAYFRGARIAPDFPHFRPFEGSKVVVMCGMPASGKNTWVDSNCPQVPVVSFDDAREHLGLAHGKNEGKVAAAAYEKAKQLLRDRHDFVWNATHLSRQMRKKTLDLLYGYGAEVKLCYLEQPEREIYRRNTARDTSLRNKDIERMLFKWETPTPTEACSVQYQVEV